VGPSAGPGGDTDSPGEGSGADEEDPETDA
jgi:hypothetical protein